MPFCFVDHLYLRWLFFYHCYQNYRKTWNSQHLIINLCNILNIYIRNNQLINTLNMRYVGVFCYVNVFCFVNVFCYFYVFCNVNVFCYNLVSFTIKKITLKSYEMSIFFDNFSITQELQF